MTAVNAPTKMKGANGISRLLLLRSKQTSTKLNKPLDIEAKSIAEKISSKPR
jgi:hypothetical protein